MAGTVIQSVAAFSTVNTASTKSVTIAATAAGSVLYACGVAWSAGTRTFSSNGTGTWTELYDSSAFDGFLASYWVCLDPGVGTTQVTMSNGGTNSYFTFQVFELGNTAQTTPTKPATTSVDAVAAWDSLTITPTSQVIAIGTSIRATDTNPTCTQGSGWTACTGTGFASGINDNTSEGDVTFAEYGLFEPATISATGTWAAANESSNFIVAFESVHPPSRVVAPIVSTSMR